MPHLILLGDSIFDNAVYVLPDGTAVIDHVKRQLPRDWQATLVAVDGNITVDVLRQLERLPKDATHLVVSIGGNDALQASGILMRPMMEAEEIFRELTQIQQSFQADYREMLRATLDKELPLAVCTIYDSIPGMQRWELTPLSVFNDTIIREAARAGVPVIDLREICTEPGDYAFISPIEPSTAGGFKIAQAVSRVATTHDFSRRETVVYGR
jgi:hypothetical protein